MKRKTIGLALGTLCCALFAVWLVASDVSARLVRAEHYNRGTQSLQVVESFQGELPIELEEALARAHLELDQSQGVDNELGDRTWYNKGNAYFLQGDFRSAINSYKAVLRSDHKHDDARNNLELAQRAQDKQTQDKQTQDKQTQDKQETGADKSNSEDPKEGSSEDEQANDGGDQVAGLGTAKAGPESEQAGPEEKPNPVPTLGESLEQKLEALERRSSELARGDMLRRSNARVRNPKARKSDQ